MASPATQVFNCILVFLQAIYKIAFLMVMQQIRMYLQLAKMRLLPIEYIFESSNYPQKYLAYKTNALQSVLRKQFRCKLQSSS
jgi:hypothetical protein